jgi:hypothetical protein
MLSSDAEAWAAIATAYAESSDRTDVLVWLRSRFEDRF